MKRAAELRDKKICYSKNYRRKRQKVSNISEHNIDVIGIAKGQTQVCVEIFLIRNSKMIERHHYFLKDCKMNQMQKSYQVLLNNII